MGRKESNQTKQTKSNIANDQSTHDSLGLNTCNLLGKIKFLSQAYISDTVQSLSNV